ncbi:MAG TPA: ChbG/HpnK family deacetylase [Chloroflexi bacterium]|nr:ChbG/HpnK family deacetylase [Chloroflexota bacterium]
MRALIIINGDDFGAFPTINEAIIKAHREGILTSASLMVTGKAADEAIALARANPSLAVGLHVTLAEGWPALPPSTLGHLVNEDGKLSSGVWVGLAVFFNRRAQEVILREMEEQFRLFAQTGLPLSHVDGHLHFHLHPSIFPALVKLAEEYGARGIRIPRDDWSLAWESGMEKPVIKATWGLIYAILNRWALNYLRTSSLAVTDRVYGLFQSGNMREAYVSKVLESIRGGSAELYFHPTAGPRLETFGPNPGDLETLLSPRLRKLVEERDLLLGTYPMLAEGKR